FERTDNRTKTTRIYRVWYHARIIGLNYITDPTLEGPLGGITGKDGILKMMWDVYTHLSGNFLELAQIREAIVGWANPAFDNVVVEDGQDNRYAATGELLHKIRLKDFEALEQQASPPEISNVASTAPTVSSITITYDTNKVGTSLIVYGTDPNNLNQESTHDETLVTSHSVPLSGLLAGTTHYFKPRSRSNNEWWGTTPGKYTFKTKSAPDKDDGKDAEPYQE
ncbi:fibronectin type III domain-containing protein, partial [Patescibacteria group bacterium]|nr:fibronectin type III domain-containing protein [Patescibacteria group bacterium]